MSTDKTLRDQLTSALREAMENYLERGEYTRTMHPAIIADRYGGIRYGSALEGQVGEVLWDLKNDGLGWWTPEPGDNLDALADAAADAVLADLTRP